MPTLAVLPIPLLSLPTDSSSHLQCVCLVIAIAASSVEYCQYWLGWFWCCCCCQLIDCWIFSKLIFLVLLFLNFQIAVLVAITTCCCLGFCCHCSFCAIAAGFHLSTFLMQWSLPIAQLQQLLPATAQQHSCVMLLAFNHPHFLDCAPLICYNWCQWSVACCLSYLYGEHAIHEFQLLQVNKDECGKSAVFACNLCSC